MSNNLIEKENKSTAVVQTSPMQLIEMAISANADIDKLERLMDLQDRYEATNARKSFFSAMSAFNASCPTIIKRKKAHNNFYAPLGDIHEQIKPTLNETGLSFRFEQDHSAGIEVTCIVTHIDGHSERTTMRAPADTGGSKSPIQAIASTVSYLQRYTLCSALGITTADEDMDGRIDNGYGVSESDERWLIEKLCTQDEAGNFNLTKQGVGALRAAKVKDLMISNVTELQLKKIKGMIS